MFPKVEAKIPRLRFALLLSLVFFLAGCIRMPAPTLSSADQPVQSETTPEIEKLIAVKTMAQRLNSGCLLLPASSFRHNSRDGHEVHFYRHPFDPDYFGTQWSLLDSIWPEDSSYAGYVVDRNEMTPDELSYLGPLPRLSTVSIPYPDRETARQAREAWAENKAESTGVRREDRGEVIFLEWIPNQAADNSLFNLHAAAVVLEDGRLVLLQSNRPELIPALLEAHAACMPAPLEARSFDLPDTVSLANGTYDIPWHLEPDEDLVLTRRAISLAGTNSEYIPVGADYLKRITPLYQSAAVTAYSYTPPSEWDGTLPLDKEALAANPFVQVCLGCVTFYSRVTVLALEFADQATAADFTEAIYATEFGRRGGEAAIFRNGAVLTDEYSAFLHTGRFFYVINSWMPDAISAFIE